MRMGNKGPHGRPWIWLMAVIVICLAPVMDPIAADITVTALAVWAMASSRSRRRHLPRVAARGRPQGKKRGGSEPRYLRT